MAYLDEMQNIWVEVCESFKTTMPPSAVELWFGKLKIVSFVGHDLTMSTDSPFKFDIISEKYISGIEQRFAEFLGFEIKVKLILDDGSTPAPESKPEIDAQAEDTEETRPSTEQGKREMPYSPLPPFNFEYTFDNFIVGNSNRFAHAACLAVANHPAEQYNPLFIYGPSGLGKTHLLYAINNRLKQNNPDIRIIYIKGEDFTNQLIEALSEQKTVEFRERYRRCDVLLIDDIQFIAGKTSTQEEFFHTFNALYEDQKQIILTSDRPPRDIKTLEDRLKTRFEWGLLADIEPPDLELRIAIIKKKAEQVKLVISDEVLVFLAENLRSNIRQIEGAIKKLGALAFLSGKEITMEVASGCISELLGGAEPLSVTIDKIFTVIFKKYGITREEIVGKKRDKPIALARHVTIYLVRKTTEMSFPNIGKLVNRDHATVMSSISYVEKRLISDRNFAFEIPELIKEVGAK